MGQKEVYSIEVADMKCKQCGEDMEQKGVMRSGNSRFQIYRCRACDHEEMECLGLE